MKVTIELDSNDDDVLSVLGKLSGATTVVQNFPTQSERHAAAEQPDEEPEKKAPAKKAAAKKAAKPKPPPAEEEGEASSAGGNPLEEAVEKATALLADNKHSVVKKALKEAGAARVTELDEDNVHVFLEAL